MDYIKAFGVTAPGRPAFVNGNPAAGIQGSIPDVRCWEYPMREILAVIEGAGLTPTNANLSQLYEAILAIATSGTPSVGALWHIGTASGGSSSVLTTTLSPSVPNTASNFFLAVPITTTNTLASGVTTINWGAGPKPIVDDLSGANSAAGSLPGGVGYVAVFFYDGTSARLVNPNLSVAVASLLPLGLATHGIPQALISGRYQYVTGVSATDRNTFVTSAFSGGQFTVGAGEGGIYTVSINIKCAAGLAQSLGAAVVVNGNPTYSAPGIPPGFRSSNGLNSSIDGTNSVPAVSHTNAALSLSAGDVVVPTIYMSRSDAASIFLTTDVSTSISISRNVR